MELKNVLLASGAALALTAASSAQAGTYFTVFGGAGFQSDVDAVQSFSYGGSFLTGLAGVGTLYSSLTGSFGVSAELDAGYVLGVAYGRDLNPHWRWELELAYRENRLDDVATFTGGAYFSVYGSSVLTNLQYAGSVTVIPSFGPLGLGTAVAGTGTFAVDGSVSFFSIMSNFWYDFIIADNWEAFVGGGIGIAQANIDGVSASIPYGGGLLRPLGIGKGPASTIAYTIIGGLYTTSGSLEFRADGSDWVLAYQFGVGAGYTLDNGVRFSAQYRFFGTEEAEIDNVTLEGQANEFLFGISFPIGR